MVFLTDCRVYSESEAGISEDYAELTEGVTVLKKTPDDAKQKVLLRNILITKSFNNTELTTLV